MLGGFRRARGLDACFWFSTRSRDARVRGRVFVGSCAYDRVLLQPVLSCAMARQYYCSCTHSWCNAVYGKEHVDERNMPQLFGLSRDAVQRASMLRMLRPNGKEPAAGSRPRFAYHHLRAESFKYDPKRNQTVVRNAVACSTQQQPPPAQENLKWDSHAWVDPAAPATTPALAALRTTVRRLETGATRGTFTSSSARFTEEHLARHDPEVDRVALETSRDFDESDPSAKRRRSTRTPPPPSAREVCTLR